MREEVDHSRKMYIWFQKNNRNISNIHKLYTRIQMDLSIIVDNYDENKKSEQLKEKIELLKIELKELQQRRLPG